MCTEAIDNNFGHDVEALFNSNEVWQEKDTAVGCFNVERVFKSDMDSLLGALRVVSVGVGLAFRAGQCTCFLCQGVPDKVAVTLKRRP